MLFVDLSYVKADCGWEFLYIFGAFLPLSLLGLLEKGGLAGIVATHDQDLEGWSLCALLVEPGDQ